MRQAQPHQVDPAEDIWEGYGPVVIYSNSSDVPGTKGTKGMIIGKEKNMKHAKENNKLVGQRWTSEAGSKQITHADILAAEDRCLYIAVKNTFIEYHDLEKHKLPFDELEVNEEELEKVRRLIDSNVVIGRGGSGKVVIYSNLSDVPGTKGKKGVIIGKETSLTHAKETNRLVGQRWTSEAASKQIRHADILAAEDRCLYIASRNTFIEYYDLEKHKLPFEELEVDEEELAKVRRVIDSGVLNAPGGSSGNGKVIIYRNLSEVPGMKGAKGVIIGKEKSITQAKQNKLVGQLWTSEGVSKQITCADILSAEGGCSCIAVRNTFVSRKTQIAV